MASTKERRNVLVALAGLKIFKTLDFNTTAEVYLVINKIKWPMAGWWILKADQSLNLGSGKSGRVIWEGIALKGEKLVFKIAIKEYDSLGRDDTFVVHEEIYLVGDHSSNNKQLVELRNDRILARFKFWDNITPL
ncbi:MAG: hypothetical protein ACFFDI_21090 [Promethearchaeota archaeon]